MLDDSGADDEPKQPIRGWIIALGRWEKLPHLLLSLFILFVALAVISVALLVHYLRGSGGILERR